MKITKSRLRKIIKEAINKKDVSVLKEIGPLRQRGASQATVSSSSEEAAKPKAASGAKSQTYKTYKIKKGDTLSKIAQKANLTGNWRKDMKTIAKINKIKNVDFIRAGDTLQIPSKSSDPKDRPRIVKDRPRIVNNRLTTLRNYLPTYKEAMKKLRQIQKKKESGKKLSRTEKQLLSLIPKVPFDMFRSEPNTEKKYTFREE